MFTGLQADVVKGEKAWESEQTDHFFQRRGEDLKLPELQALSSSTGDEVRSLSSLGKQGLSREGLFIECCDEFLLSKIIEWHLYFHNLESSKQADKKKKEKKDAPAEGESDDPLLKGRSLKKGILCSKFYSINRLSECLSCLSEPFSELRTYLNCIPWVCSPVQVASCVCLCLPRHVGTAKPEEDKPQGHAQASRYCPFWKIRDTWPARAGSSWTAGSSSRDRAMVLIDNGLWCSSVPCQIVVGL